MLLTQLDGPSLLHLFSFLDKESRWRLAQTCLRLRGVFLEPSLWPRLHFGSPAELARRNFLLGPALRRLSVCWHSSRVRGCNREDWAKSPLQRDICAAHRDAVGRLLRRVGQRCPNLQSLTLSGCGHVTDADLVLVLQRCPGLRSLRLENCVRISDRTLEAAALGAPALRSLQVDFCRNVTWDGLQRLRRERPSLALQAERSADMMPDQAPQPRPASPAGGKAPRKLLWR